MHRTILPALLALLTVTTMTFPITSSHSSPFSINPLSKTFDKTHTESENFQLIQYTTVLENTGTALGVYQWTSSALTNSAITNFAFTIDSPRMTLLKTLIMVAYRKITDGTYYLMTIDKTTLNTVSNVIKPALMEGVYFNSYNLLLVHVQNELVINDPQGAPTDLAVFTPPTAFPDKIRYLYPPDESKIFTFYSDIPYFLERTLNTNVVQFGVDFLSPTQVALPSSGVQCACFNHDYSAIFILDIGGNILLYSVQYGTVAQLATTTYTGIQECYYLSSNGVIVLGKAFSTGTYFFQFDLMTLTQGATYTSPNYKLVVNYNEKIISMAAGTNVEIFTIVYVLCGTGLYFDTINYGCSLCTDSTICLECISSLICTSCVDGYVLDTVGGCIVKPVPITPNSSTSILSDPTLKSNLILAGNLVNSSSMKAINKIPGSRKLMPFLCFLVNIDQIWLYQYHQRDYGKTMNEFFDNIQALENQKWNVLEETTTEVIYQKLGTSRQEIFAAIDTKVNYTQPTFRKREGRGQSFLPACWEFLTFNLIFVLVTFLLLRWGFNMLFNYRISILLRPFSFLVFLAPMLFDGNLQYFCFLMFSQISMGFSLNFKDKALNVLNYLLYFIIIFLAVVSSFLSYYLNKKLTKYLIDNWKTRVRGLISYSLTNAVRMLLFGAVHSLLRKELIQLPVLLGLEVFYILFFIYTMRYWQLHKVAYKIWFTVIFTVLRVIMILLLYVQQCNQVVGTETREELVFELFISMIVIGYMFTFYIATVWELIYEIVELFKPKKPKDAANQRDQNKKKCQKKNLMKIQPETIQNTTNNRLTKQRQEIETKEPIKVTVKEQTKKENKGVLIKKKQPGGKVKEPKGVRFENMIKQYKNPSRFGSQPNQRKIEA